MASAGRNEIADADELFFLKKIRAADPQAFQRRLLDQRLAGIRHQILGHSQSGHLTGAMPGEDAMGSLGFHELHLDDSGSCLVHACHTTAWHRLEGEQRHRSSTVAVHPAWNSHV